jgi:hypothetical protein
MVVVVDDDDVVVVVCVVMFGSFPSVSLDLPGLARVRC